MRSLFLILIFLFLGSLFAQYEDYNNSTQSPHAVEIKNKKRVFYKLQQKQAATPNQTRYDVTYYRLNLEILSAQQNIKGYTQINAVVNDGPIANLELNFHDNMTVDSVISGGGALTYTHQNHILDITLDQNYATDQQVWLKVYYHGDPSQTGSDAFVFSSYAGKPHFWTLSEPYGAREWWPCKDVPEDKADSADIYVTVPEGMIVASNGLLVSEQTAEGKTTFHWKERYPIVTYLISLAGYEYIRYSDTYQTLDDGAMPIEFFVYPDHYQNSEFQYNYGLTKDMITAFAGYFGEYPFVQEKYGHAEFLWGGGMEHQTCSSLSGWGTGLIAHELAHQWWGDMVTCRDFHHIWLNEGFATYSEALWREYDEGMSGYFDEISGDAYKGPGTIYVEDDTDENAIFDSNLSYSKAAYVLHMLRHVVGDDVFFDILHAYYADTRYQYGTAVTEDFQQVCEQVSGMNLDKFFQQWIYGEYYPAYEYSWKSDPANGQYRVHVQINQTQTNTGLFWMPVDVNIHMTSGDTVLVVWDSLQTQQFDLYVDAEPINVGLDEDNWILCDKTEVPSAIADAPLPVVNDFAITRVYPNPFGESHAFGDHSQVTVEFKLDQRAPVSVSVYDTRGRLVRQLEAQRMFDRGLHHIRWDGSAYASGVYYLVIDNGTQRRMTRVLLMK